MLTLAICDDNKTELDDIAKAVGEWRAAHSHEEIEVMTFSSPYALLNAAERGASFDIFLLDILMPEMTGIQLSEKLSRIFVNPMLIYLTSSEDFYPEAFRLYVFQYLLKPMDKRELWEVLDKAFDRCEKQKNSVFALKTTEGTIHILLHNIVYAELLSHVCYVHLSDGTVFKSKYLRSSFDDFVAPLLGRQNFVKTHTSFVANLNFAGKLTSGKLSLTTGDEVPISRAFSDNVHRQYMEFALQGE